MVRLGVSWSQVVRAESAWSGAGPGFSVPFEQGASLAVPDVEVEPQVDCVFLGMGPDLQAMEVELEGAVLVTVVGSRQAADLASAAAAIVGELEFLPQDMSIREYYPRHFLVLCRSV